MSSQNSLTDDSLLQQGGGAATKLQTTVQIKQLQSFYDPQRLQALASKVGTVNFDAIAQRWKLPREMAYDLAAIALYDVVLYVDDSGSMAFEENGERIDDLKFIIQRVGEWKIVILSASK